MPRILLLLWILTISLAAAFPAMAAERPNVVIVLTDDQGMGDFSCYGNPVLKTPNLDRLHDESIRFSDFHVCPMCTPTRGELMTGRDAVRNGATSVTGGRAFLRRGLPTMPECFAGSGYKTGIFGKWHLGDNFPHRPMDRGFQTAVYHMGWGFTSAPEFTNTLFDGEYSNTQGKRESFEGHCTDVWFDKAIEWMRERKNADEPFFCYLPQNAPHTPHFVADKYSKPYEDTGRAAKFFGMIAQIDENMAKLASFLKESGLRENTILVFMTDNGGTYGVPIFNAGLRDRKTSFYDGGHRVPCWIRWPAGKLGEPRDIETPTQVQDVLPTLLELCGAKAPANAKFDGTSLAGVLRGEAPGALADRTFVVQYSRAVLTKWECAVVSKTWRLVHGTELFDVSKDRGQQNDLAKEHPEIVKKLRDHYEKWWKELEPLSTTFVTTSIGSKEQPVAKLTSSDWQDVYADNAGHVSRAAGGPRGGPWNVKVEKAGEYQFTLSRWPPELNLPLDSDGGDAVVKLDVEKPENIKAVPVRGAKLLIGGQEVFAKAEKGATNVVLRATLPTGEMQMQAWFVDDDGSDLCGAFYADVNLAR